MEKGPHYYRKKKKKKKKNRNSKFPGTGFPSWLGPHLRYNALPTELWGTCHKWKANFKIICNKWSIYFKEQVHQDSKKMSRAKGIWKRFSMEGYALINAEQGQRKKRKPKSLENSQNYWLCWKCIQGKKQSNKTEQVRNETSFIYNWVIQSCRKSLCLVKLGVSS